MIRILIYVALVFAIAAGFAWLADRPGDIVLTWQGYEIHTSLMVAAIAVAAAFVALAIVLWLLLAIFRAPALFSGWMSGRRRDRGYRALSRGMIAIGAGDLKLAKRYALESRKILDREPLTLLLGAQTAQLAGDAVGARTAFEAMLEDPETRLLGLRGLFVEAQRAGEHGAARHFAEEAAKSAPALAWAGTALFDYQAADGEWRDALLTLGANLNGKLVDRTRAHRYRAVLLTARGMELENASPAEARNVALEAAKMAPDLVPAATLAARLLVRINDQKRASRIVETSWKRGPHPELAEAYASIRPSDSARDRLKRAERLAALMAGHVESRFAVARAALDARDFGAAKRELAAIDETHRTERFCLLMADIADEEGDRGSSREWLGRAIRAPRDPVWMADGYVFPHWAPVSPVSRTLDAFAWRVPSADPAEGERPSLEMSPTEPPAILPAVPIEIAAVSPSVADPEPVAPLPPAPASPAPAPKLAQPVDIPPSPDDPGPEPDPRKEVDRLRLQ